MTQIVNEPQTAADGGHDVEALIDALEADPRRAQELFPLISAAPGEILPGDGERPLVILPRADAWADS